MTRPSYPNVQWGMAEAAARLAALIAHHSHSHHFYPDSISLCDATLFRWTAIQGPNQLTDLYLLGLCQQHNTTLVTFDSGIRETVHAVVAARANVVRILA